YPGPTIPYTSGATVAFAGVSFDVFGNLNNGDAFTLGKNLAGVSDGRNALTLGLLQTQNTMSGKSASYQSAYAQLVSDSGNKSRELEVKSQAQSALLKQSTDARDSLSGVNLDEEAANLMRYQQAYQASAKMLDIGNKLFDSLLAIQA
ncbi:MAG: flagellar hook-associated protein FlgK, partial [Rhodoferax sp.]|nr:flagellar hook-associated protein FlgK [Rhodoferax sp.]